MKSILHIFIVITSLLSAAVCFTTLQYTAFSALFFLPLTYLISYFLIYRLTEICPRNYITIHMVVVMLWLRMVLTPMYGTQSDMFIIDSASLSEYSELAILLCIYEAFAICLTLYLICRPSNNIKSMPISLRGNPNAYWILIVIAILVFLAIGRHMGLFEFGVKAIGEDIERDGDIVDTRSLIVRSIISSGYLFLFFVVVEKLRTQYESTHKSKYINYCIILAILMVCIIVGERRTSQLYIAFASCWLLIRLFPYQKRSIISFVGGAAVIVISIMTIYKQFHAFLYGSYIEALQNTSMSKGMSPELLDAYFYGIDTVIKNISYGKVANLDIGNLLYDFVRSTFGLHFFFKSDGLLTSQAYNMYIYSGNQTTGLLISSIGYGYIYFGFILAPIFTCINLIIMCSIEKRMRICDSIEMAYIWAFIFMRFGFGFLGAIPPLINIATQTLLIKGGIYFAARYIIKR